MNDQQRVGATDEGFAHIESLLREIEAGDSAMPAVPDDVWEGIEAAVSSEEEEDAEVVVLDHRRRFSPRAITLGAAAAVAMLIAGGVAIVAQQDDGSTVVASADLSYDAERFDPLGATATASVSLVDDGGGAFHVEVDESMLPTPTGEPADLELWLIEPDADGNPVDLVSIGVIDPENPGDFEVPAGYDPDEFFVVDISVEPRDGDATHSGRSILRGPLVEA